MTTNLSLRPPVARLRAKNQLTLPESVVSQVGADIGDRFRVSVEDGVIHLEPVRKSYYGALKGVWPPDWMEELRKERDSWARRESW